MTGAVERSGMPGLTTDGITGVLALEMRPFGCAAERV